MSCTSGTNPRNPLETVNYCSHCTCEDCRSMNVFGHCSKCACCTGKFELQDHNDWNKDEDTDKHKDLSTKSSDAYESPRKRVRTITVATSARGAVDKIAGGNLCLITLQSKAEACLELCHVMPRSLDDKFLTRLEYVWGMKYRSLYLDSRYNMLNLTPGLHGSFDSSHWALIPLDRKLISRLSRWPIGKAKSPIEKFYKNQKQELFTYALLPLDDMDLCIARRNKSRLQEAPSRTNLPDNHYFPYTTFPPLESHIRPHFVIINLMHKVRAFEKKINTNITECQALSDFFQEHEEYEVMLGQCEALFNVWMVTAVPEYFRGNYSGSLASSGGGTGNEKAGDAGTRGGGDGRDSNNSRRRTLSRASASRSGSNNAGCPRNGQHRPEASFPASAPEDPAEIWDCDEVGLRPVDSVTHISGQEEVETDDDELITIEENDYAFKERVSRWVASIDPMLTSPHDELNPADDKQWTDDDGKNASNGSPTMVGSLLLQFNNHNGSVDPTLITTRLLGKADQTTSQLTPIDSKSIEAAFVDLALVSA